jgi:hypothetical protein
MPERPIPNRCTEVADRAFPDGEFSGRDIGDRRRSGNETMDRTEFLSRFADLANDQLHTLRRSARLDEWPKDQSFYVEISKLFFVGDPFDIDERQRFVQILHR